MTDQPNPLCICGQKYTMTEDNHAVNCPAHAYYAAWQKMQPIPSPQGAAMSDWPEYEPVWKMIENRVSGASPQGDGVETLKEALIEIAGMYSKWDPDGSYASSALFQASERARQALASLPPAIEAGPTTEENAGVAWDVEIIADAVKACEAMPEELTRRQLGSGRTVSKMESVAAAPQPSEPLVEFCKYCDGRTIYISKDVITGQEYEVSCLYCNETGFSAGSNHDHPDIYTCRGRALYRLCGWIVA